MNVIKFPTRPPINSLVVREIAEQGTGLIGKWLSSRSAARARLRIRIQHLRKMPRTEWQWKQFHALNYGLSEFKWEAQNKQFRLVGFDFDGAFVLLIGCTHKMNVYEPHGCLETAKRIKGEVERGERTTISFEP